MQRLVLVLTCLVIAVSACSTHKDTFYKHQPSGQPLDVPPDLTIVEATNTFEIPEISQVTMKKYSLEGGVEVSLVKDGLLRWVEVAAAPDVAWEEIKEFWLSNNVQLAWENQEFGIIETTWLQSYDSKFDLDRFRIRVEGKANNKTEIFLTHRGKQQTFEDGYLVEGWVETFNDPELEIELLAQMLSYMGLDQERKDILIKEGKKAQAIASLDLESKDPHILINDDFERSWKLCVQAADRAGHVITVREKAQGWFELRLVDGGKTADFVPGFALSEEKREVLRIQLKQEEGGTRVFVTNDAGQQDQSEQARNFLRDLNQYL